MSKESLGLFRLLCIWMISCSLTAISMAAQPTKTRLLIRIDDMGFSHAVNVACLETYQKGIARSVEVLVTGPWFEEAAQMLRDTPGLDAGVHLTLTSEWSNLKWRPLTKASSLVDEDGYFFPMIWRNRNFPELGYLKSADWELSEIEAEWRAQIELAKKKIPQLSHLSGHMGCQNISPEARALMRELAKEYELDIYLEESGVKWAPSWSGNKYTGEEKEERFLQMLASLEAGDWLVVEHPGYDVLELQTVGHKGYENVAADRAGVTKVFTSEVVVKYLQKHNIELISYKDLK